jgi:hypothetical protein
MERMGGCLCCSLVPVFNLNLTICGFDDKVTWFDKPMDVGIRSSTIPVSCQTCLY